MKELSGTLEGGVFYFETFVVACSLSTVVLMVVVMCVQD